MVRLRGALALQASPMSDKDQCSTRLFFSATTMTGTFPQSYDQFTTLHAETTTTTTMTNLQHFMPIVPYRDHYQYHYVVVPRKGFTFTLPHQF